VKFGTTTPDRNSGLKLVIPVKTRTPLEALQMLRAGQPIDVAAGYYSESGILEKDFYMMDDIDKLHALAAYREQMAIAKTDMETLQRAAQLEDEDRKLKQKQYETEQK